MNLEDNLDEIFYEGYRRIIGEYCEMHRGYALFELEEIHKHDDFDVVIYCCKYCGDYLIKEVKHD